MSGRLAVACTLIGLSLLTAKGEARAQTMINVNNVTQLYSAIDQVNANPSVTYYIQLAAGTYALTRSIVVNRGAAVITGSPTSPTSRILDGQGLFRVLFVNSAGGTPAFVQLSGVTVQNGHSRTSSGGGIAAVNASVYVINSIVRNNTAEGFGAGIHSASSPGIFYVESSLIENNVGRNVTLNECNGGFFTNGGGVVVSDSAEAYIFNSSIIGNQHCRWGGVASVNTHLVLIQNTIARNRGVEQGGGVIVGGTGSLYMLSNTVAENETYTRSTSTTRPRVGAGLFLSDFAGRAELYANIFANNRNLRGGPGAATPIGEDFWSEPTTAPFPFTVSTHLNNFRAWPLPTSADSMGIDDGYVGTDPMLFPLGNNGAAAGRFAMPTYSMSTASFLYRSYWPRTDLPSSVPWSEDQRGFARPSGQVTLGAIEP